MAWEHLDISKPHLVYVVLGGFTSIFMLVSSVIKERLYIGEATVATLIGIIFGPHAANLVNPLTWGNVDQITLEFSRIVLVVQCFAVGVELPKAYMNRHWRSVLILLIPVMTTGWIVTTLVVWWMFHAQLGFLGSLCVAACVTATDPVLASSVVGKGKFAKRVPKHLRDVLSAESGCNDGMAFPFIYLALYLLRYHSDAKQTIFHWLVYTILYECIFGCFYGLIVGYAARRAIRYAHEHDFIDRESFLVFYFVLALFCAGSGSMLGLDDLLVGFACGVGFSNDGWFQEKTEESHVSNVIDLLINLAFFVYFGTIIPWEQYNSPELGIQAWRLVVLGIFVLLFRRIPIMLMLKPVINDVKTWREALFAGHFGPIGVGAIFVSILARAELETGTSVPLAQIPTSGEFVKIIQLVWPITTFLVIVSILIHGSSIAVFTLGRHINTLTLTISFTNADDGPSWMDRLPRISTSRSRTSLSRPESEADTTGEKPLTPSMMPKNFLSRRRDDRKRSRRSWDVGIGPGGPISPSAITPASQQMSQTQYQDSASPSQGLESGSQSPDLESTPGAMTPREEIYREGSHVIIENEQGNVKDIINAPNRTEAADERIVVNEAKRTAKHHGLKADVPLQSSSSEGKGSSIWWKQQLDNIRGTSPHNIARKRGGPARAYTFGNNVIVEDEDGEVIKQYHLPSIKQSPKPSTNPSARPSARPSAHAESSLLNVRGLVNYFGSSSRESPAQVSSSAEAISTAQQNTETEFSEEAEREEAGGADQNSNVNDDEQIRYTISRGGRRLNQNEFIDALQKIDSRSLADAEKAYRPSSSGPHFRRRNSSTSSNRPPLPKIVVSDEMAADSDLEPVRTVDSIPSHAIADALAQHAFYRGGRETGAQTRRRQFEERDSNTNSSTINPSPSTSRSGQNSDLHEPNTSRTSGSSKGISGRETGWPVIGRRASDSYVGTEETAAEKRRRQIALGIEKDDNDDSDDDSDGTGFRDLTSSNSNSGRQRAGSGAKRNSSRVLPVAETIREEDASRGVTPSTSPRNSVSGSRPVAASRKLRWSEDVR